MTRNDLPPANYVTWPKWANAAVIIWMVSTFSAGIWYTAKVDSRLSALERQAALNSSVDERITRLEERFVNLQQQNSRIIDILEEMRRPNNGRN